MPVNFAIFVVHKVHSRHGDANQGKKCKLDYPSNTQLINPFSCPNCPFIIFAKNCSRVSVRLPAFLPQKIVEGGRGGRRQHPTSI